jgi:CRP-like cAMP-binding protein
MLEWRAMFPPADNGNVSSVGFAKPGAMSVLDSVAAITSCSRGQDIYRPGDAAEYWYRVVAGLVRKCADAANGQRQIVDFLMPGDFFGFATGKEHQFGANAAVNGAVIARYPRRRLEMLADTDPELARLIRQIAFKAISRLQDRMLVLGRTTALCVPHGDGQPFGGRGGGSRRLADVALRHRRLPRDLRGDGESLADRPQAPRQHPARQYAPSEDRRSRGAGGNGDVGRH